MGRTPELQGWGAGELQVPGLRPARSGARLIVSRGVAMAPHAGGRRRAGVSRPRRLAGLSGAARFGRVFGIGPVRRDAGQLRQGPARRRQGVADALLNLRVAGVKGRAEFCRAAQIPGRRENAEATRTPGQVVVDPVRRLAGVMDDIEHVSEWRDRRSAASRRLRARQRSSGRCGARACVWHGRDSRRAGVRGSSPGARRRGDGP